MATNCKDTTDYRQQASELRDFLLTETAQRMNPEASVMAGWLTMLLTSCTPDAIELLPAEIEAITSILQAAAIGSQKAGLR